MKIEIVAFIAYNLGLFILIGFLAYHFKSMVPLWLILCVANYKNDSRKKCDCKTEVVEEKEQSSDE